MPKFSGQVSSQVQVVGRLVTIDIRGAVSRDSEPFWTMVSQQSFFMDNQQVIQKIQSLFGSVVRHITSYQELCAAEQYLLDLQTQLIELGREAAQNVGDTSHIGA